MTTTEEESAATTQSTEKTCEHVTEGISRDNYPQDWERCDETPAEAYDIVIDGEVEAKMDLCEDHRELLENQSQIEEVTPTDDY